MGGKSTKPSKGDSAKDNSPMSPKGRKTLLDPARRTSMGSGEANPRELDTLQTLMLPQQFGYVGPRLVTHGALNFTLPGVYLTAYTSVRRRSINFAALVLNAETQDVALYTEEMGMDHISEIRQHSVRSEVSVFTETAELDRLMKEKDNHPFVSEWFQSVSRKSWKVSELHPDGITISFSHASTYGDEAPRNIVLRMQLNKSKDTVLSSIASLFIFPLVLGYGSGPREGLEDFTGDETTDMHDALVQLQVSDQRLAFLESNEDSEDTLGSLVHHRSLYNMRRGTLDSAGGATPAESRRGSFGLRDITTDTSFNQIPLVLEEHMMVGGGGTFPQPSVSVTRRGSRKNSLSSQKTHIATTPASQCESILPDIELLLNVPPLPHETRGGGAGSPHSQRQGHPQTPQTQLPPSTSQSSRPSSATSGILRSGENGLRISNPEM